MKNILQIILMLRSFQNLEFFLLVHEHQAVSCAELGH